MTEVDHLLRGRPEALTHPLFLATNAPDGRIGGVIKSLELSVPAVLHTRRAGTGLKIKDTVFRQKVEYGRNSDAEWDISLISQPVDEAMQKYSRIFWRGDITLMMPEKFAPDAGDCETVVRFRVTSFWLQGGILRGAAELALTRHLLVTYYRSIDPSTRVIGGRHDWSSDWLPSAGEGTA